MNAIVLVIDRLHCGYVGAYGNSWIATPAIDRLASEGFLFDQCLIDSPRLETLYRSLWLGSHALAPARPSEDQRGLARLLAARGIAATLLTDDPAVASHPLADGFEMFLSLPAAERGEVVQTPEETHLAGCFAQLVDQLESAQAPFCVWCHLKGLAAPWDAPLGFRRAYMEEGDPEPPLSADVPDRMLPGNFDPDELLGFSQAYAGQVTLLDTCLGALLEFLQTSRVGEQTALVLLSARGFPLGEHRRLGACDEALYNELVHVPLVLRFPDGLGAAGRSSTLVQPSDLWATLLDLWGVSVEDPPFAAHNLMPLVREVAAGARDRLGIAGIGSERAIATPVWYLRMPPSGSDELYVRPDDRWQVNDVTDRCSEVAEKLREAFVYFSQAVQSGQSSQLPPLDEVLLTPPE